MSAATALMPIPGVIDPVPVPRAATARADGRVELVGLRKEEICEALEPNMSFLPGLRRESISAEQWMR